MQTHMLQSLFSLGAISVAEKIIRPILVYVFLIIGLRLAGKRELAQLNPFDLVVLLTLSNAVQNAIIGDDNSVTGGVIGASTLLLVNYAVVRFLYGHQRIDQMVEGAPDVLIENGAIQTERCQRELITERALEAAAHKQGFQSLADVDRAVIESGGTISFFGRTPTPDDARHRELLMRLDQLTARIEAMKA
ncbi:MAG TPA: YetF domain-containing protein [Vicinamibacterales bacterium]